MYIKKSIIAVSCVLCSLSLSASEKMYGKVSFDSYQLNHENEKSALDIKDLRLSTFSFGVGYKLTENISFETTASLPTSNETVTTNVDTFILDDTAQSTEYTNELKLKYLVSANVKLDFPIHERFDFYILGGYSKINLDYDYSYTATNLDYGFTDNKPSDSEILSSDPCIVTGIEEKCKNDIISETAQLDDSGFFYGGGFRFYYTDNTTLGLTYKSSVYDRFDIDSLSLDLSYKF